MSENDQEKRSCGNSGKIADGFPAASERHELIDSGESTARPSVPSDAQQSPRAERPQKNPPTHQGKLFGHDQNPGVHLVCGRLATCPTLEAATRCGLVGQQPSGRTGPFRRYLMEIVDIITPPSLRIR
jgi:hypothetical protein